MENPPLLKVVVTGSRYWTDYETIKAVLQQYNIKTLIHGAAPGVDTLAAKAAKEIGIQVIPFPADWLLYKRSAGPIRNRQMLDQHPHLVLAFHEDIHNSKGTKDCVQEALKRNILVYLYKGNSQEPVLLTKWVDKE